MRKLVFLALGFLSLSVSAARVQEPPSVDLAVGYSYFRERFGDGVNAHGGSLAFTGYANRWLGGDFGAYRASPFGISANTYTYLAGPRFAHRSSGRFAPYAQILLGGAHLTQGASGVSASANGYAWGLGGGTDLGPSRRITFRPQLDYIGIRAGGGTASTVRASAAIVFRFGPR